MELFTQKKGLLLAGLIAGCGLAILAFFGNPQNMAMCAACFIRDMAGSLKLHTTATVQYFRPEIVGLVVGSFLIAVATREYRSTAGSSPMTRFVLDFIMMLGALAQKARICFASGLRNAFLARDFEMLLPIAGMFVVMLVFNLATGNFKLSFDGQPIAHSQHLWNILGLYAVGFGAVLAGGCPLRQMILAGQGSCDGAVTFLGMLVGAAFAHNFGLAGAAAAAATADSAAVAGGPAFAGQVVLVCGIVVLFVIGAANIRKQKAATKTATPTATDADATVAQA